MTEKLTFLETLCKKLGNLYQIREVESDYVISRWFGKGYVSEIEFCDNPADKFNCIICLYRNAEKIPEYESEIMEEIGCIGNILSVDDLEKHLTALEEKYCN